ncbi:MAG: VWA domain-containing protein [Planctomycetes bacterium]|nr:VWA domain-containing protein [Planctomycetota bacterium]
MSCSNQIRLLVVLAWAILLAPRLEAADPPDPEFIAARQAFLKEMKKKSPAARAEAIAPFAKFPLANTVDTLLKKGLGDPDPTVRVATRVALREIGRDPQTAPSISEEFKRYIKKQANEEILSGLLGGMIATTDDARQQEVLNTLDDYLASPRGHLIVPISLIDDLGKEGGDEAVNSIKLLARSKVFDKQFGYRRAVVQAMVQIHQTASLNFLIEMLPGTQGLIQADIVQYLTRTTKQKFKDNDRDWSLWWKENQATFKLPPAGAVDEAIDLNESTYYGIPICAKRIVFVLDTSVSMRGQPMEAAKIALLKTVESLPEAVNFDIIFFDQIANVWQPRLVPASMLAKQTAAQTVMAQGMKLGTASHAALNAAFNLDPEVIYFLSDGEPTDGQPQQIVQSISERNRTRRITIHTIGVVTSRGGGAGLSLFMKPLAEHNYGMFRLVQ